MRCERGLGWQGTLGSLAEKSDPRLQERSNTGRGLGSLHAACDALFHYMPRPIKGVHNLPTSHRGSGPLRLPVLASRTAGAALPPPYLAFSSAALRARSSAPHLPPQMDQPTSSCSTAAKRGSTGIRVGEMIRSGRKQICQGS